MMDMRKIPDKLVYLGHVIEFKFVGRGRFKEESNYIVYLDGNLLCMMKVFRGRGYYKPWIELYSFTELWSELKNNVNLFKKFLHLFSCILEKDESLYIEYFHDASLTKELEQGRDVEATFIGRLLYEVGFRGFKDWYIPEGMWEGGQKIEAWK